ncbi:MAG: ribulose-phosphate 3-epimerase [Bacteroidota bacterium]
MYKKLIAPSILNSDFANLQSQIRYIEMGGADWIHCDIMDGHFVPNLTFGAPVVKSLKKTATLPMDVHLMVENPDNYIEPFHEAGASILTVHQEATVHLHRTVMRIKELGMKAGVSVNPATPLSTLTEIIQFVDLVLIMSVNPGFGGQQFIQSSLRKVRELNTMRAQTGTQFLIEIDGGVDKTNIREIAECGCDVFVAGSAIFRSENISAATAELKNLANSITV